jgi:hypothetical protein
MASPPHSPPFAAAASLLGPALLIAACGGDAAESAPTTGATTTAGSGASGASTSSSGGGSAATGTSGAGGSGESCPRELGPADRVRKVLVSHPYDAAAGPADVYEVFDLSTEGELSTTGVRFEMGRATLGEIAFTPDGRIALAPQEDGSIGVVRFGDDGTPDVLRMRFQGDFYAGRVVMEPDGQHAIVVDPNFPENGGGLYRLRIRCDDSITDEGLVATSKSGWGLALVGDGSGRGVLAAKEILGSAAGDDAHLITLGAAPARLGGADAFGDDAAIVGSIAVSHDGRFAFLGDNSVAGPNRVAVVAIDGDSLAPAQLVPDVPDPIAIVPSPFDNAAMVVSGFGDAIYSFGYDPGDAADPLFLHGEIAYAGAPPALPSGAVLVDRGALTGLALVAENVGIRRVRFEADGLVSDLGAFELGGGLEDITGSIGVQP